MLRECADCGSEDVVTSPDEDHCADCDSDNLRMVSVGQNDGDYEE